MLALILKYTLVAIVGLLVIGGTWWAVKHPNRAKGHPNRQRMPIFLPIVGWLLTAVGLLMVLVAFTVEDGSDILPMRIAAVAILAGGLFFLFMYRNWYVEPGLDEIHFRTVMGREKTIAYADIADYRTYEQNGQLRLAIRSNTGVKLSLDPRIYRVEPLIAAITFKQKNGRWPLRGEAR